MFTTIMNHISACLYDDLLLPQSPLFQLHFNDMHLLLYLNQHISIITYQYHHDNLISYNDLMHKNLNQTNSNLTIFTHLTCITNHEQPMHVQHMSSHKKSYMDNTEA